ncbi:unnamed protein product, partial [Ectocarpus sp. 12 AP-2014]
PLPRIPLRPPQCQQLLKQYTRTSARSGMNQPYATSETGQADVYSQIHPVKLPTSNDLTPKASSDTLTAMSIPDKTLPHLVGQIAVLACHTPNRGPSTQPTAVAHTIPS